MIKRLNSRGQNRLILEKLSHITQLFISFTLLDPLAHRVDPRNERLGFIGREQDTGFSIVNA